ncbi:MAG TPA: TQO small subunit DoxD [Candidatus Tumulicola sp.]
MTILPSSRTYAFWLALVRIVTGVMWIAHGVPKFTNAAEFMPPNGAMAGFLGKAVTTSTGSYHTFLTTVVVPNIGLFAELVRLGEVLVGVSLVLGAATRLGGLVGVFLALNYIFAKGNIVSTTTLQGLDLAMLVLSGISLVLPAGRALGVDALFIRSRRPPAPAPVRAEFVPEPPLDGPTASPNP